MSQLILFTLLGLGTGALIAGLALSLVLTYQGSGIINLATGAVAMVAAYAFWALRTGQLGLTFSLPLSLIIAMLISVLCGVLIEVLAFRPLRTASPLAKLVASLGLLLLAEAGMLLAFGSSEQAEPTVLPTSPVKLFGSIVPVDNLILTGIVLAAAVILTLVYKWTKLGLSTRAAAENEVSAILVGLSPNRLSMVNTLTASLVAGALGLLVAPISTLDPDTLPLQVVPALAAALVARFTSFWIACIMGLAIGALENILYYLSTKPWFPTDQGVALPGVQQLLIFIIMVIAMFWRGGSLPGRGELVNARLPRVPRPKRLLPSAVMMIVVTAIALVVFPFDFRQALVNSIIYGVLALSLVVITGFVGQISVVQLALAGAAGFLVAHLSTRYGIGFPWGAIIGVLVATVLGVVTGASALRVRGVQLAVLTLAAAVAFEEFWFFNGTWGGGQAGARVPQPHIFGLDLGNTNSFRGLDGQSPSPVLGFGILIVAVLLCVLVANLPRTNVGQRMLAVRSNERAAAAIGINVRNVKLGAFALSSFIAGVAGAMFAYNFGSVSADQFDALTGLTVIAFAYIGGITMVSGALLAGLLSTEALFPFALQKWFGLSGTWSLLFGGATVILNLVAYPEGIAGTLYSKRRSKQAAREREQSEGDSEAYPDDVVPAVASGIGSGDSVG